MLMPAEKQKKYSEGAELRPLTSRYRRVDIVPDDDSNSTARFGYLGLASEGASASLDEGNFPIYIHRIPIGVNTSSSFNIIDGDKH